MLTLSTRRETTDGQRPGGAHLDPKVAARFPLPAFSLLRSHDLFDPGAHGAVTGSLDAARQAIDATIRWTRQDKSVEQVRREMIRQLVGNPRLAGRMANAKPIRIDIVASHREMIALGYPKSVARHAAGIFWDRDDWSEARIGLRRDRLDAPEERTLVVHEYAHAIHYLGFTQQERDVIADALRPVFGHPADQDEVFAIYSEREFLDEASFSALERAAPGVYGVCRQQWSADHAFAAFIKKLYRPGAALRAGDQGHAAARKWKSFTGG